MGVAVSVVVPYHPSDEHRQRAWGWVRARYAEHHPDWEVVEGRGGEPWCKAAAVADGVVRASGDVLVVADADVWLDDLDVAVRLLAEGAPWVIPHRLVHRLNREATTAVLDGVDPVAAAIVHGYDQRPYPGWPGGGVVVLRRDDYPRAPLDPRFAGWGQEDLSWSFALDAIVGPHIRTESDLWHLWHPPQRRLNRVIGSEASEALGERYRKARRRPDRMAELIEEGRQAWHGSR